MIEGYSANVTTNRVQIGCQRIPRSEVEKVAVIMGIL